MLEGSPGLGVGGSVPWVGAEISRHRPVLGKRGGLRAEGSG